MGKWRLYDFVRGRKESIPSGCWNNGNKRFVYHFKKGTSDGLFTEWYETGKLGEELVYKNGEEISGKGWREKGKLYLNEVLKKAGTMAL